MYDEATMLLDAILWADARILLPLLPDQSFHLAFADPPYWVGYDYGTRTDHEMEYVDPDWLVTELRRVARTVLVTPGVSNIYSYPPADWMLGWFKPGSTRRNQLGGFNVWEPILCYGAPTRRVYQDAINLPTISNIAPDVTYHKCPKPLHLLTWLIESFTEPDDLVLDPFVGSGTTAKAAKMLGRHWLGCDSDPLAVAEARQRVTNTPHPLLTIDSAQAAFNF